MRSKPEQMEPITRSEKPSEREREREPPAEAKSAQLSMARKNLDDVISRCNQAPKGTKGLRDIMVPLIIRYHIGCH